MRIWALECHVSREEGLCGMEARLRVRERLGRVGWHTEKPQGELVDGDSRLAVLKDAAQAQEGSQGES